MRKMGTGLVAPSPPWAPPGAAATQTCGSCLPPPTVLLSVGTAEENAHAATSSGGGLPPLSWRCTAPGAKVQLVLPAVVGGVAMAASLHVGKQRKRMRWPLSRRANNVGSSPGSTGPSSSGQGAVLGNIFDAAMRAGGGTSVGFAGPGMPFGGPGGNGQQQLTPKQQETRDRVLRSIREFRMRPRDVKAYLDRFVIEQKEAKKVLAVALCDHYNWARRCIAEEKLRSTNYTKPNILILGPTGSGKTYLVRTLAKMLGVPFVKADATKFSETGIVGEDAEDVVRGLVDAAGGDAELAQYGIVYIDEVDKIATGGGGGRGGGWSGRQVQSNFLKIMEETEVSLQSGLAASLGNVFGGGSKEGQTISTKFMLFIFSGAFNSLNDRIKDRVESGKIGFLIDEEPGQTLTADAGAGAPCTPTGSEKGARSYLHLAETSDFVEAGLEPEFIGRVPVRVAVDALDANDLFQILTTAEDSIVKQYENEFKGYGIQLKTEPSALRRVAELATEEKTGARALVTILERTLRDFKFELPSTTSSELTLSTGLIADPRATLDELLSTPERASADLQQWIQELERNSKVRVELTDDVRDRVVRDCADTKSSAETVLELRFRATGVVEGLKKIHEATEGKVAFFSINMAMYEHPEEEIEKWRQSLTGLGSSGNGS